MCDHRLKDFPRVGERFVEGALTDGRNFQELLFRVEKNDAQRFVRQKPHLRTELRDGERVIESKRLAFFPECNRAHPQGTNQTKLSSVKGKARVLPQRRALRQQENQNAPKGRSLVFENPGSTRGVQRSPALPNRK